MNERYFALKTIKISEFAFKTFLNHSKKSHFTSYNIVNDGFKIYQFLGAKGPENKSLKAILKVFPDIK